MTSVIGKVFIFMKKIYIYSLKDPETDEVRYIGKTTNINKRLRAHITRSKTNTYHSARWIKSLINKGLKPNIELVEECTESNWVEREKFWISYYRERFDLTNILDGGEGGFKTDRYGSKWSNEQRENNRSARLGVSVNHTNEGNNKRAAGIRKYYNLNKKAILQYSLDGNFIKEWESAVEAGKELNVSGSNINRSCKNHKLTTLGFQWRYKSHKIEDNIGKFLILEKNTRKEIIQVTKENVFIKEYSSLIQASRETNIKRTSISNCLTGRSSSSGGYKWFYKQ